MFVCIVKHVLARIIRPKFGFTELRPISNVHSYWYKISGSSNLDGELGSCHGPKLA